jgi:hypothetical protein
MTAAGNVINVRVLLLMFSEVYACVTFEGCLWLFLFVLGQKMEQDRTTEVQRGGRDVEGATASKHCTLLRLLGGGDATQQKSHHPCHRAYDLRNLENVGHFTILSILMLLRVQEGIQLSFSLTLWHSHINTNSCVL